MAHTISSIKIEQAGDLLWGRGTIVLLPHVEPHPAYPMGLLRVVSGK